MLDEGLTRGCFGLRSFTFVMRKDEVTATTMEINGGSQLA
jgi:hypothetical protein